MAPGKKRKASSSSPTVEAGLEVNELRHHTQDTVTKLGNVLDQLEESGAAQSTSLFDDASLHLLQLKSLQRRLLDEVHKSQETLSQQRGIRSRQELQLENLKYQKVLNDHAIEKSQNPDISNLVLLCRSELEEANDHAVDDKEVIQNFLQADSNDPIQRAVIVDKLNQQLRMRKKLDEELEKLEGQVTLLKQSLNEKRKVLESLPSKLHDLERASQPLRKFCQKSLNASRATDPDRLITIEQAHSLPKALYALFYTLQSALHTMEASGDLAQFEKHSMVPLLEVQDDPSRVLLMIPIPVISDRAVGTISTISGFGGGKKLVPIAFEYNEATDAIVASCTSDHNMGGLLKEVFPGDTGEDGIKQSNRDDHPSGDSSRDSGRPYSWCNYLGGLHLPPTGLPSKTETHKSATTILRRLVQRVRAQATLNWILHALSRKPHPLPVHPSMKEASFCQPKDSEVRLVSWNEDAQASDSSMSYFLATLKCRASTMDLRVGIPAAGSFATTATPIWELNPAQDRGSKYLNSGDNASYDDDVSKLERRVRQNTSAFVDAEDETTSEWILAHQLSAIATKWEELIDHHE